jgi:rhodanese-related sulfurtransferase
MKNLSQEEWRAQFSKEENAVIIDARTPAECETGIVENAIMIDFLQPELFLEEIKKLDKSKPYYMYCRSGNRSGQACQIMDNLGFSKTINLIGGMNEWNAGKVSPN